MARFVPKRDRQRRAETLANIIVARADKLALDIREGVGPAPQWPIKDSISALQSHLMTLSLLINHGIEL